MQTAGVEALMKLNPSNRKRLLIRGSIVGLLAALSFYVVRFAPLASRIVGSWPTSDADGTTVTTYKPNGEWESVTTFKDNYKYVENADGSGVGKPSVFKGRYTTRLNTFRTFDVKRYVRIDGEDVQWTPSGDCVATNTCNIDAETLSLDKEPSNPKYFSTIISADWWAGRMRVRASPSGGVRTWIRQ